MLFFFLKSHENLKDLATQYLVEGLQKPKDQCLSLKQLSAQTGGYDSY